ncbi:hypothetical protein PROFUN_14990 [Planoprotostelium fungivorum]|uniref:Uncharacterized protein n=1 Tax=Planoprotostelium fungivorum TaxID=1890364 RepID=A0A2P6MY51_9EUKA|nr:hypothetical protein PROFUN_14990 [Planoprotostelium fungivorum]
MIIYQYALLFHIIRRQKSSSADLRVKAVRSTGHLSFKTLYVLVGATYRSILGPYGLMVTFVFSQVLNISDASLYSRLCNWNIYDHPGNAKEVRNHILGKRILTMNVASQDVVVTGATQVVHDQRTFMRGNIQRPE